MNGFAPYLVVFVTLVAGVLAYLWKVRGTDLENLHDEIDRLHSDCHSLEILMTRLEEQISALKRDVNRHRRAGDE